MRQDKLEYYLDQADQDIGALNTVKVRRYKR